MVHNICINYDHSSRYNYASLHNVLLLTTHQEVKHGSQQSRIAKPLFFLYIGTPQFKRKIALWLRETAGSVSTFTILERRGHNKIINI